MSISAQGRLRCGPVLLCLGLAAGWAGEAHSALLGTLPFAEDYSLGVGPNIVPSGEITIHFAYSVAPGGLEDITTMIFDGFTFTAGDSGRVVTLSGAADDAEFDAFVAHATDGVDDDVRDNAIGTLGGGLGHVNPESGAYLHLAPTSAVDFAGMTVTALELFIADIVIDPEAGIGEFNWSVSGELRIYGEPNAVVPVPGAAWLLMSGAAVLVPRLRRRAKPRGAALN